MKRARLKLIEPTGKKPFVTPRGFQLAYRPGEANRCLGCGRSHWQVGRVMAECAFCDFALPIVDEGVVR